MAYVLQFDRTRALELPAGEAIVIGDVLCIVAASSVSGVTDGTPVFKKADADAAGLKRPTFVAVTAQATAGKKATGARDADIEGLSPAGTTPACGDAVFLHTTAGGITKTVPATNTMIAVCVGILLSATRCLFSLGSPPPLGMQTAATSTATLA